MQTEGSKERQFEPVLIATQEDWHIWQRHNSKDQDSSESGREL
jgi:hypothetical protein